MAYKLIITEHADELIENILHYLLCQMNSEQAARHFLDGIENIYERLEENPLQFPLSRDAFLAHKNYHEAIIPKMDYVAVFNIETDAVNVVGMFHQSENYQRKMRSDGY